MKHNDNDRFDAFFSRVTRLPRPHRWQSTLGADTSPRNRLIRIPTGLGKTMGVLTAWAWNRLERDDDTWPRRLVWCLPMRVLVEQTRQEAERFLTELGVLWNGQGSHEGKVGVHLLMGGADSGDWHLHPEQPAVLIGTQDMLLSRALNRGYGAPRGRWPIDFGLLNQDALWIMDEVQLMDVGLATSAQLQAFSNSYDAEDRSRRPRHTWWMSATLQKTWIEKSPETRNVIDTLHSTQIPPIDRTGHLWDDVSKRCRISPVKDEKALAELVTERHTENGRGANGPTLVVVNRVERAAKVFDALRKTKPLIRTDLRLVHSRFRPLERMQWSADFLRRDACGPDTDRIIVATQVIEAGVDISAGLLVTELAPWPSLVQRFGRAARWGGASEIVVVDCEPSDDKKAAPYIKSELDAARGALGRLTDVSPQSLERFEEEHPDLVETLYPYEPTHLLLQHELEELFDTTPDLSGSDVDVSRFIRSGDERDLHVFWTDVPQNAFPSSGTRPSRQALCAVPFLKARDWLCGKERTSQRAPRLKNGARAWVWDWLDGSWRVAERQDLYPGTTVLVSSDTGGYTLAQGWSPESTDCVKPVPDADAEVDNRADSAQENEALSEYPYQTIAVHGREIASELRSIAARLVPELTDSFDLAGRWHDLGKGFPAFNNSIVESPDRPARGDLAKAPKSRWLPVRRMYPMDGQPRRAGFRHELAGALALFAVLQRHNPDHEALLGPWRDAFDAIGMDGATTDAAAQNPGSLEREILSLDASEFNLIAYLVCSHHGKVRAAWHASPADQNASDVLPRIHGVRDGDILPTVPLFSADGALCELPETVLDLSPATAGLSPRTGSSWAERVINLVERWGPFTLAWLEAIMRAADVRVSKRSDVRDELLYPEAD